MINAIPSSPAVDNFSSGASIDAYTPPTTNSKVAPAVPAQSSNPPSFSPQLKPKKKFDWKVILGSLVLVVTIVGGAAGFYLMGEEQDTRQQAFEGDTAVTTTTTTTANNTSNTSGDLVSALGSTPGEGFRDWSWNYSTQCFDNVPSNAMVNSWKCDCPNGVCPEGFGSNGCQDSNGLQAGYSCFQPQTCGVVQVDIAVCNGDYDATTHTCRDNNGQPAWVWVDFRSKWDYSGCVQPPEDVPWCNSPCTDPDFCQGIGPEYSCVDTGGGDKRCRLTNDPGSQTCGSTPQPTNAPGPQCLSVGLINVTDNQANPPGEGQPVTTTVDPDLGETVRLVCGAVPGAVKYRFRVYKPDGTKVNLTPDGDANNPRRSDSFVIDEPGRWKGQCTFCTGTDNSTCAPYEKVFIN
jgi:hypothetical protein